MRNIKLTLSFDGTDFCGWQIQPDQRTVQGEIVRCLREGLQEPELMILGCGRTDSGVHAQHYVAGFSTRSGMKPIRMLKMLNSRLDPDISILNVEDVPEFFNARYSSMGKWYQYRVLNTTEPRALEYRTTWHMPRPLDCALMREGAQHLIGRHDFTPFAGKLDEGRNPIREISSLEIEEDNQRVYINVRGPSFLNRMVRIITGTLVDVGTGLISPAQVAELRDSGSRKGQRASAPACGLTLMEVFYE